MKFFFALFTFLACTAASATSCAPGATCDLSKVGDAFLAMAIVTKDVCAQANPSQAEKYTEAFEKMLNQDLDTETRDWINKTISSPEFISKIKEGEMHLEKYEKEEIMRQCARFLSGTW